MSAAIPIAIVAFLVGGFFGSLVVGAAAAGAREDAFRAGYRLGFRNARISDAELEADLRYYGGTDAE